MLIKCHIYIFGLSSFCCIQSFPNIYEVLVSFDVVSLFTFVPVDKALGLILELSSGDSLPSHTSLDIFALKMVLNFVSIFQFYHFFLQKFSL